MEEQYIDVNETQKGYEKSLARFKSDPKISDRNKELMLTFIRDAALGKTMPGRAKKKIGLARLTGYIYQLYPLIKFVYKPLDQVTQADMERFIEALESDQIRSRATRYTSNGKCTSNNTLGQRYKVDIKITIKKFYKWLWGKSKTYPEIVEWIDTYCEAKETPSLTEREVKLIIDRANTPLQRVVIQVLFDGGLRLGELLNVRLCHLQLKNFDPNDPRKRCFFIRIPFSKTLRRTVALPMSSTSKWLSFWLEDHPAKPVIQNDGTVEAEDISAQLFPITGDGVRQFISRLGKKAIGKRVYPHLLRHTSATYWSNKLPYFKFCKRFGWTMTSNMPQRYIDREGVDEMEVANIYHKNEMDNLSREKQRLIDELAKVKGDLGSEKQNHTLVSFSQYHR